MFKRCLEELHDYLLEKWDRKCSYCGVKGVPLQIEHIQPRAKGGSDRIANLCLACEPCNLKKGTQEIQDFLKGNPDLLKRIQAQAKRPLKDATAVNSTRWKLFETLKSTGLAITTGSGGQTKFNRVRLGLPKEHWIDAACVGEVDQLLLRTLQPLRAKATGHGTRQMAGLNKFGFPVRHRTRTKFVQGFQTGDIVKAVVTKGSKIGVYVGRVAVRSTGSFNISTVNGLIQGINHKYCSRVFNKDGYAYEF
jgi:hypothetical protein